MDSHGYTALWLTYHQSSLVYSPRTSKPSRLMAKFGVALVSGLLVSGSWGSPVQADWGRVVYANTPPGYALNLRWGPGTGFGVHRKVLRGTSLTLTEVRRHGWLQLTDGTWVASNLVTSRPIAGGGGTITSGNIAYVVTPPNLALNIRSGPGTNYARVGQFLNGTRVRLTGRFSVGWAQLVNGNWVDNSFLRSSYPGNGSPTEPMPPSNPDVVNLQRRLIQLGYLPANFVPNGIYDQATQQAVREFQRLNGLPVTGVVDAATWLVLYEAGGIGGNPSPTPSPTPTSPILPPNPTPTPSPTQPPSGEGQQMRVVTDGGEDVLVFEGPDPATNILRTLANGSLVKTTGQISGNWTELVGGGWVFTLYLETM
jgi:uncharacterized protein YraI